MKGLAITSKGIEDIAALEIKEIIKAKTDIKESCIIFQPKELLDLCKLCYKAQSLEKVLLLFDNFSFSDPDDLYKKLSETIKKASIQDWLDKTKTFRASSKKVDNDAIHNEELNSTVGELIINKIKKEKRYLQKVDLDNPGIIFFVYIMRCECYLGIDMSGFELHKRDYRVFSSPRELRATVAYSLSRIAGYEPKGLLLDPFCSSGSILIEAALFAACMPVNFYRKDKFIFMKLKPLEKKDFSKFFESMDKKIKKPKTELYGYDTLLHYVQSARKNAKIAGIQKQITFSRVEIDWMDLKFKKDSVDRIVTQPPALTQNSDQKEIGKMHDNLFYQAEYILKKTGTVTTISPSTELLKKSAEKYKFKPVHEREVMHGKTKMEIVVFGRI